MPIGNAKLAVDKCCKAEVSAVPRPLHGEFIGPRPETRAMDGLCPGLDDLRATRPSHDTNGTGVGGREPAGVRQADALLTGSQEDILAYIGFPHEHWEQIDPRTRENG